MDVYLARIGTGDQGTPGVLTAPGFYCVTMELPWRDNKRSLSCIPIGSYRCTRHRSPHFGETFWVRDVPGRSSVLIHAGNFAGDSTLGWKTHSEGCILVGSKRGALQISDGKLQEAVLASRPAHRKFMEAMTGHDEFTLHIWEA